MDVMPNVIRNNLSLLKRFHYVSAISRKTDYWGGLKLPSLERYESRFGDDFNIIIYDSQGSREFFSIPYATIKPILDIDIGYLPDQRRWQYSISDHVLKIHGSHESLDIRDYFQNYSNIPQFVEIVDAYDDLIESDETAVFTEGGRICSVTCRWERNQALRGRVIEIHGASCQVCGFNFYEKYGDLGLGFIEVHHLNPISKSGNERREVHPELDLSVLCSNCHRMIHRDRDNLLSTQELRNLML